MTITLTREEAQQVLEAFETIFGLKQSAIDIPATVETLRARLAQPEKEWKGLTSGERKILWAAANNPTQFGELLEAKLKEKNT
jgi:hypothetical protein